MENTLEKLKSDAQNLYNEYNRKHRRGLLISFCLGGTIAIIITILETL